jgi:hypothetical protein
VGELAALTATGPDPREEVTPEPPVVPVSRPGDLWLLGRHRLMCGDSTNAADVCCRRSRSGRRKGRW